jgi:hypothetical protein
MAVSFHPSEELDLFYNEAIAKLKQFGISNVVYRSSDGWKETAI